VQHDDERGAPFPEVHGEALLRELLAEIEEEEQLGAALGVDLTPPGPDPSSPPLACGPLDAWLRRAEEVVLDARIEADEVVLACWLDRRVAEAPEIASSLAAHATTTAQPLLQVRLVALSLHTGEVGQNPNLHETARALLALDARRRASITEHPARLWALLSRVPLVLPGQGYHVRALRKVSPGA
jgi:hypothetical protein